MTSHQVLGLEPGATREQIEAAFGDRMDRLERKASSLQPDRVEAVRRALVEARRALLTDLGTTIVAAPAAPQSRSRMLVVAAAIGAAAIVMAGLYVAGRRVQRLTAPDPTPTPIPTNHILGVVAVDDLDAETEDVIPGLRTRQGWRPGETCETTGGFTDITPGREGLDPRSSQRGSRDERPRAADMRHRAAVSLRVPVRG